MAKRCQKGKSCGASCIERSDDCFNGLSRLLSNALFSVRAAVQSVKSKVKSAPQVNERQQIDKLVKALNLDPAERLRIGNNLKELRQLATDRKKELWDEITKKRRIGGDKAKAQERVLLDEYNKVKDALQAGAKTTGGGSSAKTKGGRIRAKRFDDTFNSVRSVAGSKDGFDWEGSIKGSKFGGKGAFGVVLFSKDGDVVKRGEVGKREADILQKVGRLGLGPSLVYGEVGSKKETFAGMDIHFGRIVMSKVEGQGLNRFASPNDKVGNSTVADLYWAARAKLHRAGIAHNDSHTGNFLIDPKGNGKFIDFGMAQDNPKAALSEALGGLMHRGLLPAGSSYSGTVSSDFQAQSKKYNPNTGFSRNRNQMPEVLGKIHDNLPKVESYLTGTLGLSPNQAAIIMASGIRNPDAKYETGAWAKVSPKDAEKMIDLLYEGI